MMYLLLLLAYFCICILMHMRKIDIKKDRRFLIISFIFLLLFMGLRGNNVGLDMVNYKEFFRKINGDYGTLTLYQMLTNGGFEKGFVIYTILMSWITNSFGVYIFITTFLSLIGIYFFVRDNSKNYFLSVFIFITFGFFINVITILRQAMAISILLYSVKYIKEKRIFPFIFCVIFAAFFHKTALIFIITYFLQYVKLTKIKVLIYLIANIIIFFFRKQIVNIFTTLLYNQYLDYGDTSGGGYKMLLFILGIALFVGLLSKKFDKNKFLNNLFLNTLLLSIPFQILSTSQGLIARIVFYYSTFLMALIPNVIESYQNGERKSMLLCTLIFFLIFYILQIGTNHVYVDYTFLGW